MPEGDTLVRTAATLRRWLVGETVTGARTSVPGLATARFVGRQVEAVEARGKHLLVRFDGGPVLHTHLRMTGSWHAYRDGDRWRRPERQARLVIQAGDRVAVCFNAPVVELLAPEAERVHPSLGALGPDVLAEHVDLGEVVRRARTSGDRPLGDVLLDQRVVAGIGNIWRSETLFLAGHHPWAPVSEFTDEQLGAVIATAAEIMHESLRQPARHAPRWVYRRAGRPCRRCGELVRSQPLGEQARVAYWCPSCQPEPA
jgi:endonuclease-8